MTYLEKLKHPNWQKKRLLILERDNFTCRYCSDKETELHIHHLKYHKNPWDAKDENLVTLCKDCHGLVTAFNDLKNIISIEKTEHTTCSLMFFVKYKSKDFLLIEIFSKIIDVHSSIIRFKHDGIGINKLISLNNG